MSNVPELGVEVGVTVALGVAVAVAFTVAVAVTVALTVGVAVGLVENVQPLMDTRTSAQINSKGNAFFNGMLMQLFIILVIGFINTSPLQDVHQRGERWLNNSDSFFPNS
jgi:hypothetical protein